MTERRVKAVEVSYPRSEGNDVRLSSFRLSIGDDVPILTSEEVLVGNGGKNGYKITVLVTANHTTLIELRVRGALGTQTTSAGFHESGSRYFTHIADRFHEGHAN